jgi:hypothetical protein
MTTQSPYCVAVLGKQVHLINMDEAVPENLHSTHSRTSRAYSIFRKAVLRKFKMLQVTAWTFFLLNCEHAENIKKHGQHLIYNLT